MTGGSRTILLEREWILGYCEQGRNFSGHRYDLGGQDFHSITRASDDFYPATARHVPEG